MASAINRNNIQLQGATNDKGVCAGGREGVEVKVVQYSIYFLETAGMHVRA
jgi:hypothetical protein